MKHVPVLAALLLSATACASERSHQFLVLRPPPKSLHSEMESEAALAKIDAYLKGHGFRSQLVDRKTPSGFVAARQWTKPGIGVFSTYTHADGSLAISCRSTAANHSSSYIEIAQGLRAIDYRALHFTVHEATRL
jgi:hypothetical protein